MDLKTAVIQILQQAGTALHTKELTEKAIGKGWLITGGKTPEATMYAQMITEIKRQQKRGERPRFVQHGRGYVGLSQWMGRGLAFPIEQHNHQVTKRPYSLVQVYWKNIDSAQQTVACPLISGP